MVEERDDFGVGDENKSTSKEAVTRAVNENDQLDCETSLSRCH